ncbi:MAG: outer membrane protein assembly factor BamC, partial [Gammaproteobacteria bacterium]
PVSNLYRLVKSFWASEGYQLVVDEPAIGIMQTEWIYKEEGAERKPDNWFAALFGSSDLSATQDQFRTRIERGADGNNRIYITHRGTEYQHVLDSKVQDRAQGAGEEPESDWHVRESDPELEVEMLSRLMIYLGMKQADVDRQVADAGLFEPRAFMQMDSDENSPYLLIKDPYQIAWNRVLHYLEQMNFEVESQEFKSGFSGEGVIFIKTLVKENPDEGGFFSFKSTPETSERRLILVLSEESHDSTRVNIENDKGDPDTTPAGAELLRLLYRRIK